MNIVKKKLMDLEMVYSTTVVNLGGERHLVGASENRDQRSYLFSPPAWNKSVLWDRQSGVMNIVQEPGCERLLSITDFYPIFQSEGASIYEIENQKAYADPWAARKVLSVPYVHRIGVVKGADRHYLLCCGLCESKEFQDDWSKPGSLFLAPIPDGAGAGEWPMERVYHGLTKNHGLHIVGGSQAYVSAEEGIFRFDFSAYAPGKTVVPAVVSKTPTSDVYLDDIDGDGMLELGTIEPFHGNTFALYRLEGDTPTLLYTAGLDFGHVVWVGRIFGIPSALTANRGGARETILHQNASGDLANGKWERTLIDAGVGATQISVFEDADGVHLFAANHGIGEIALYTLTP